METKVAFVDVDGVLKRESLVLPGVPELFQSLHARNYRTAVLSNGSRRTGAQLREQLREWKVRDEHLPLTLTSADATGHYLAKHVRPESSIFVLGEKGIHQALKERNLTIANDQWDGQKWKRPPTHVVVGFNTAMSYEVLAPAWNAVKNGATLLATNGDESYRNEAGMELPANGANVRFLSGAGKPAYTLGKPSFALADMAFERFGMRPEQADVTVIGDSLREDALFANTIRDAGARVRFWLMLSGLTQLDDINEDVKPFIDQIYGDIRTAAQVLLQEEVQ
jgi:HAD superfamily hydrolase (TIGR01450 family)